VLVIIDTLFRLTRVRDVNAYSDVTQALDPLLAVARDLGAHVMLLHHSPKGDPRQAVEAALGSIAITGTVDTIIAMRKTDHYRTIISEGREGAGSTKRLPSPSTRRPGASPLGSRVRKPTRREPPTAILEWLGTQTDTVEERAIHDAVDGRKATKERALRRLFDEGKIIRTGGGKRGDPYLYAVSPSVPPNISREGERENSKTAKNPHGAEQNFPSRDSATSADSGRENPEHAEGESVRWGEP
jgi:hypothetical protein